MNKHQRVLAAIFEKRANIAWPDIEAMLLYQGAEISEGRGSRGASHSMAYAQCSIGRILKKRQIGVRLLPCGDFSLRRELESRGSHDIQGISIKSRVG